MCNTAKNAAAQGLTARGSLHSPGILLNRYPRAQAANAQYCDAQQ